MARTHEQPSGDADPRPKLGAQARARAKDGMRRAGAAVRNVALMAPYRAGQRIGASIHEGASGVNRAVNDETQHLRERVENSKTRAGRLEAKRDRVDEKKAVIPEVEEPDTTPDPPTPRTILSQDIGLLNPREARELLAYARDQRDEHKRLTSVPDKKREKIIKKDWKKVSKGEKDSTDAMNPDFGSRKKVTDEFIAWENAARKISDNLTSRGEALPERGYRYSRAGLGHLYVINDGVPRRMDPSKTATYRYLHDGRDRAAQQAHRAAAAGKITVVKPAEYTVVRPGVAIVKGLVGQVGDVARAAARGTLRFSDNRMEKQIEREEQKAARKQAKAEEGQTDTPTYDKVLAQAQNGVPVEIDDFRQALREMKPVLAHQTARTTGQVYSETPIPATRTPDTSSAAPISEDQVRAMLSEGTPPTDAQLKAAGINPNSLRNVILAPSAPSVLNQHLNNEALNAMDDAQREGNPVPTYRWLAPQIAIGERLSPDELREWHQIQAAGSVAYTRGSSDSEEVRSRLAGHREARARRAANAEGSPEGSGTSDEQTGAAGDPISGNPPEVNVFPDPAVENEAGPSPRKVQPQTPLDEIRAQLDAVDQTIRVIQEDLGDASAIRKQAEERRDNLKRELEELEGKDVEGKEPAKQATPKPADRPAVQSEEDPSLVKEAKPKVEKAVKEKDPLRDELDILERRIEVHENIGDTSPLRKQFSEQQLPGLKEQREELLRRIEERDRGTRGSADKEVDEKEQSGTPKQATGQDKKKRVGSGGGEPDQGSKGNNDKRDEREKTEQQKLDAGKAAGRMFTETLNRELDRAGIPHDEHGNPIPMQVESTERQMIEDKLRPVQGFFPERPVEDQQTTDGDRQVSGGDAPQLEPGQQRVRGLDGGAPGDQVPVYPHSQWPNKEYTPEVGSDQREQTLEDEDAAQLRGMAGPSASGDPAPKGTMDSPDQTLPAPVLQKEDSDQAPSSQTGQVDGQPKQDGPTELTQQNKDLMVDQYDKLITEHEENLARGEDAVNREYSEKLLNIFREERDRLQAESPSEGPKSTEPVREPDAGAPETETPNAEHVSVPDAGAPDAETHDAGLTQQNKDLIVDQLDKWITEHEENLAKGEDAVNPEYSEKALNASREERDRLQAESPSEGPKSSEPDAGAPDTETPVAEPQDKEPVAEPQDKEPVAEPQDKEPVAEPQDKEPVAEPQDKEPVAEPQDKEPVAEPQDKEPVAEPQGTEPDVNPDDVEERFNNTDGHSGRAELPERTSVYDPHGPSTTPDAGTPDAGGGDPSPSVDAE